jgi:RNA polymerase sigma-70 factor (ECF subfamily)
MIRDAAAGNAPARERFARVYLPVVRSYLAARWRAERHSIDDAAQDVFVECFRAGGLLDKVDEDRAGGFRAFLLGAVRNVARRHEARKLPAEQLPEQLVADDTGPAEAFDKAWAKALLREAARDQEETANANGQDAVRRVQLLRLRFHEGLPIRDIASRWGVDAAKLHHEYAKAREEFLAAIGRVVAFHHPHAGANEVQDTCAELLRLIA